MRKHARPLAGLATVVAVVGIVIVAAGMFRGSFADTVPVTVLSQRAGLVMSPDAKVKLVGVPVGTVVSIEDRPDGQAAILLAMDPAQLRQIPDNVMVDISSSTVFGAKSVDLVAPPNPSMRRLRPGQVLTADQPTVRSTWTVTSTCSTGITCAGKVTSSLGWTEDIYTEGGYFWFVRHAVPDWIPCPDGSTAPGLQAYKFYPAAEDGTSQTISDLWIGEDQTTGVSGNCGRNRSLVLSLPLKITKIG